jgi:pimeloyl-ACP methyl ester carboxylesterase
MVSTTLTNGTKTHTSIKNIKKPTLIIWGSDDQLIPVENAYKFNNDITNSKLVVMQQTGHVPMEEKPLESLKFTIDFLNN